jgi:DNA-binding IclR family transcriptional regulator
MIPPHEADSGSALHKALALLRLFSLERPAWSVEDLASATQTSPATCYRYVRALAEAGLIERRPGGLYGLGSNILALDYLIRRTDPLLTAARAPMRALAEASGFDCVLSGLAGAGLIDMHRAFGRAPLTLDYGRGRLRPAFAGAAAKMIAAHLPRARLRQLYCESAGAPELGADFDAVAFALRRLRRVGFYVSRGELEAGIGALAVAGPSAQDARLARPWTRPWALALVGRAAAFDDAPIADLVAQLRACAQAIDAALAP